MKKYHLAWIGAHRTSYVRLGSSDTSLIKWFLDELKKIAPKYEFRTDQISEEHDLDGNLTYCLVHKLDNKDTEIRNWLLQQLLKSGWEPFSVTVAGASPELIYLRREIEEDAPAESE
jgi:hypothetical protein